MFFNVWMAISATEFPLGYLGEDVICLNLYFLENSLNSSEVYCLTLSEITFSGIPCLANIDVIELITVIDLSSRINTVSIYLE